MPKKRSKNSEGSLLTRPIRIEWWNLFAAVTKGVVQFRSGNWDRLTQSAFEGLDALRGIARLPTSSASQQAIHLLQKSITAAIVQLIAEQEPLLRNTRYFQEKGAAALDSELDKLEIALTSDFLESLDKQEIVHRVAAVFEIWCRHAGMSPPASANLAHRVPFYSMTAAADELCASAHRYRALIEMRGSPLGKAIDREQRWLAYGAWLRQQVYEPSFGESFGLAQVYVWPNGFVQAKVDPSSSERRRLIRDVVDDRYYQYVLALKDWLDAWLMASSSDEHIRFISGGPGAGKSSFAKMYAASMTLRSDYRVLLIPLHLLDLTDDIEAAIVRFAHHDARFPIDALDSSASSSRALLLIFDGLDELAAQGEAANQAADQFTILVERFLQKRNQRKTFIRAIFLGRPISVQDQQQQFRNSQQFFQILPFYVGPNFRPQYVDSLQLLNVDLRNQWWKLFGGVIGEELQGMPDGLNSSALEPLTAEPFLNFLVASVWNLDRVNFGKLQGVNELYDKLIQNVVTRTYQKNKVHPSIGKINSHEYIRVLEEIAVAAWQSNGRVVKRAAVDQRLHQCGMHRYVEILALASEAGFARLLVSFYFRRRDSRFGEGTYEFTHKSFAEFLVTRRITRMIVSTAVQLSDHHSGVDRGKDEGSLWEDWISLFEGSRIDSDLFLLLKGEVALLSNTQLSAAMTQLTFLLDWAVHQNFPMGNVICSNLLVAKTRAAAPFGGLIRCLSACAYASGQSVRVRDPSTVLRFAAEFFRGDRDAFRFEAFDFRDANLSELDLSGVVLTSASLAGATLTNVNLRFAIVNDLDVKDSRFVNCDLRGINFSSAIGIANMVRGCLVDANHESSLENIVSYDLSIWIPQEREVRSRGFPPLEAEKRTR